MFSAVKVTGLAELNAALNRLADDVAIKHARGALAAGAALIRDEARKNAPQLTGKLKRAIYSMWMREMSTRERQTFFVSVRRGKKFQGRTSTSKSGKTRTTADRDAYYWTWIEFGHVSAGPGGQLKGGTRRRERARSEKRAAGKFVPPQPFLRPAFEAKKQEAVEAVKVELQKRIFATLGAR